MTNQYIKSTVLSACLLLGLAMNVAAQNKSLSDSAARDTARIEPGRLLNIKKINSTAAVSSVGGEDLYKTPTMNLTNTLYGRLNGLSVNLGSGEPGYDNAALGIRGVGSLSSSSAGGYNTYKVFVDGFETNLNYLAYLSAAEIESISILKDAAALATFGMRGANGVIYVTTKRGKIGKPTISFQVRTGIQKAININKPIDAFGYASLYNQAISNDRGRVWSPLYSPAQLQGYRNGTGTNVDWFAEVLKNHAPYTDGDLSFTGGDDNARYNIVLDYANQQALYNVKQTDATSNSTVKRYNLRSNLDFKMFDIFEAKVDLGARIEDRKAPNYSGANLWQNLSRYPSNIYPVRDGATGNYSGTSLFPDNPVASINSLGWFSSHRRILQGNFTLKERLDELTPGLYLSQAYSFNSYSQSNYSKTADYPRFFNGQPGGPTNVLTPLRATGMIPGGQEDWKQLMGTIGYERSFGKHQILSALNYHQSDFKTDGGVDAYIYRYQNISGRANYSYDNRYVAELGFSYFGADGYAPGNRWGFYPAISASWIVSNEAFLKDSKSITLLKLRASAGKTGSMDSETQNSGRFLYQQYYNNSGTFYTGNSSITGNSGLNQNILANPDIFAEQSLKYNFGAEVNLFKKLSLSADVFLDKRSGILTRDNTITGIYGTINSFANLGKVTNKGFELSANFSDKKGDFGYGIWGQVAYNKNKIDYFAEIPQPYEYNQQTGRSIAQNYGLVSKGFYQLEDFNANGSLKGGALPAFGLVQPGDLKYQDLNGDNIIDEKDITSVGKSLFPEMTYSFGANFSYKGFDLSALFQGIGSSSVNILSAAPNQIQAFVGNGNVFPVAQNAWAYYPDQGIDTRASANYPRLTTAANNNNYRASDFWVKSRDFLRLRNVELGYTFSPAFVKKLSLANLRFYVNAVNPLTWSKLEKDYGLDPETLGAYPGIKSFNTGLSVTF
ncbi:SusC/RagA family TonB-linked outer membrane protein [Pedobacter sp. Leaf170]|uniref:SusC/RagA family TonB-linked outer membrane protein n=1 Tax=Pedobacter sp. Leaf170 TaxID=2876558 RepID=UPI001E2B1B1C|nr:SusC/RagA family TonB-linked outer membrane protein [Pedobacter sp. Leaf170]